MLGYELWSLALVPANAVIWGANFTMSPDAEKHVFWLLAGTIVAEVIHLGIHYVFKSH